MKSTGKIGSINDLKQTIKNQTQKRKSEKRQVLTVSAGTCGQARGSLKVIETLKKSVKKKNIEE